MHELRHCQLGHSAKDQWVQVPVLQPTTRGLALRKKKKSGDGKSKSTGDKIGWVAAVAGGAVVALIVGDTASCGPGEDKSCGSD